MPTTERKTCQCGKACDDDYPVFDVNHKPMCRACDDEWRWATFLALAHSRDVCPTCGRPGLEPAKGGA